MAILLAYLLQRICGFSKLIVQGRSYGIIVLENIKMTNCGTKRKLRIMVLLFVGLPVPFVLVLETTSF